MVGVQDIAVGAPGDEACDLGGAVAAPPAHRVRRRPVGGQARIAQCDEGVGHLVGGAAPPCEAVIGESERALVGRAEFEHRDPEQRGFDAARRIGACQGVGAGEAAASADPGIGHGQERPAVPLEHGGEDVDALCRVRRDDESPVSGLPQTVQEEVGMGLEPVGSEGLAGPHRDTGRASSPWAG